MIDRTTVDRRIEGAIDTQTEVDVRIEVESYDDEEARGLADEIAQAVHGVVNDDE